MVRYRKSETGSWNSARRSITALFAFVVALIVQTPTVHTHTYLYRSFDKATRDLHLKATVWSGFRGENEKSKKATGTDDVERQLENARSYYLRGLSAIERRDTVQATRFFESAVQELSQLASTPDIEKNDEFTELAQQVIEDFESYIRNIDILGENSPTHILREKIFKDVDAKKTNRADQTQSGSTGTAVTITPGFMTTIPLTQNEYVSRCVDYLTADKGRKFFTKWIERTGKWFPMLKRIAREENMPEEIVHLAMVESALNPTVVSRASAVGMWQFMQSTGEIYKLRVTPWKDDRRDPERATRAAMRHLRDLYNDLGDWHLALAAYNCGAGGVKRAIQASGIENPNFWDIRPFLPKETRDYVPMFIATTLITMQQEAYGFVPSLLRFEPEYKLDTIVVQEPIALSVLASCAGITCDSLKCLNTDLLSYSTPPSEQHVVKVPLGSKDRVKEKLFAMAPEERLPWVLHEVQRGETLASIAARYEAPVRAIESANDGGRRSRVRPGVVLRIPRQALHTLRPAEAPELFAEDTNESDKSSADSAGPYNSALANSATSAVTPAATSQQTVGSGSVSVSSESSSIASTSSPQDVRVLHTCKTGDNLFRIASAYGVSLTNLRVWNNLASNAGVRVGQQLVILNPAQPVNDLAETREVEQKENIATTPTEAVKSSAPVTKAVSKKRDKSEESATVATKEKPSSRKITGKGVIHRVARGETLAQIADDYGTTIQEIRSANKMSARKSILAGQRLKIPIESETTASTRETFEDAPQAASWTRYKVRRGDNLGIIAGQFGVREQQIRSWNPRIGSGGLRHGQTLRIYAPVTAKGSAPAPGKSVNTVPKYYKAKRGDTMAKIARKYGISMRRLLALNNSRQNVRSGQRVRLL